MILSSRSGLTMPHVGELHWQSCGCQSTGACELQAEQFWCRRASLTVWETNYTLNLAGDWCMRAALSSSDRATVLAQSCCWHWWGHRCRRQARTWPATLHADAVTTRNILDHAPVARFKLSTVTVTGTAWDTRNHGKISDWRLDLVK